MSAIASREIQPLSALRVHGRIIACGGISSYNEDTPRPGLSNLRTMITKRLTMKGLIVLDWLDRQAAWEKEVGGLMLAAGHFSSQSLDLRR